LLVTFALVELFDVLVAGYASGWTRTAVVVALAVPAWILLVWFLPDEADPPD
jgi:hypothetical protein